VKTEAKGERALVLSEVVDEVRKAMDLRFGARPIPITNCDGEAIGALACNPPVEGRSYNQQETIRGDVIPGLDIATLTVACKLSAVPC
ncbi:MAG: hypothetical protein R3246_15870, partial [Acidimicrobiia bacterium]|nr:hypothetical protein [Acidimicrobiia bacterium]